MSRLLETINLKVLIWLGVAAGLYPLVFYYNSNFTLVNSWQHLLFLVGSFIIVPTVLITLFGVFAKNKLSTLWYVRLLLFLNLFGFFMCLQLCLYADISKKLTLIIFFIAVTISFFLWAQLKKIMMLQFLLAIIAFFWFMPKLYSQLTASDAWKKLPDDIENVQFSKTPNVYFIQTDGYVNPSELDKGYYEIDNTAFENFLELNGFKSYSNFRSNYGSTLSTNSAVFSMKHHYYNGGKDFSETLNARNTIMGENPVLNIFKNNGYATYFIAEKPYLLQTRPDLGYDYANFSYDEIPYISTGLKKSKEVLPFLETYLNDGITTPKFYFIQYLKPGHINNVPSRSVGAEKEKEAWKAKLKTANNLLTQAINTITQKDPKALIILMADHGGYVGFNYTNESNKKIEDPDKITSVFSTILSVKWPDSAPAFDEKFVSSINMFRILFAHLSSNEQYLGNLEPDKSYLLVKEGEEKGVYQYIDENGTITFIKSE